MAESHDTSEGASGRTRASRVATTDSRRGLLLAALAVFFFSTSPVLVRWADPLSPTEKTAGRLAVAAVAVLLFLRLRGERVYLHEGDWPKFIGFGLVTALHFLFYIASLSFTTIAHSLAIVYTAPIFVTLASAWFLKEPIPPRKWLGVLVAVVGVVILAGFEPRWDARMAFGDLLALGSAIMFGLYSVAGRGQRARYPLLVYAALVYGIAALWCLPPAIASFTPGAYTLIPILAVVALGIFPLGFGHTLYNAALRHTHATTVNLVATQEVTLGILLGMLLLGEVPRVNEIVGAGVTVLGIVLVML
ncbi:MAG: DMT family transporter [Chloroflexota bacterium]|nr:DMT family transporter [Chloroflexota bacterium]